MVKIRYSELPAGLHVAAEADGRCGTVVYLLPGLTPAQRRAALVRVRSSARMGQGPSLPALDMARAVAADRIRVTLQNGAAALRSHPMLLLPPLIVLVSSAIVFTIMSFVTLTVPSGKAAASGPHSGATSSAGHARRSGKPRNPGGGRAPGAASVTVRHPRTALPTPSPSAPQYSLPPAPSSTASLAPAPSPSPDESPSPSPDPSASGSCIKLGPLGLCVNV